MENVFLAINKQYFDMGLKSIDLLILAQIEEFQRNGCSCYVTNKQFSEMFGESESTVKRSLDKLEEMKLVKRTTTTNNNGGKQSRVRTLTIDSTEIKKHLSKVHNDTEQGSNVEEARFKNEPSKVHNEPIKDNLKDNIKDNLRESEAEGTNKERKQEDNLSLINKKKKNLEEVLRGMSTEELTEIKRQYDARTPYKEIAEAYNIVYFDVELFKGIYDTIYKEKWNTEHPEQAQRVKEAEQERLQREMADFEFISQIMKQPRTKKRRALYDFENEYDDDAI